MPGGIAKEKPRAMMSLSNSRFANYVRSVCCGKPDFPPLQASHDFFKSLDQTRPLAEYDFVVVDCELTGMIPSQDEIVSIGAVRIRNLNVDPSDCFYSLVEPRIPLPKISTLIHQITPDQLKGMPRLRRVLPEFVDFCSNSLLVGHHVGMDMSFLNRAARRIFGARLVNPCLDTLRLAQVYQAELWENYYDQYKLNVSYNLTDLSERFGLPLFQKHNALQDALQTAYLFLFLVRKLKKGGIETLADLYNAGRMWRWYF